jgi:hypothetical protein
MSAGLLAALIRKLVKVAPKPLIAYLIVFIGVLASVASDAGYLILIPLGASGLPGRGATPHRRHCSRLWRRRGRLHGQPDPDAHRRHADRDHQRIHRAGRRRADLHHRRLLLPGGLGHPDDRWSSASSSCASSSRAWASMTRRKRAIRNRRRLPTKSIRFWKRAVCVGLGWLCWPCWPSFCSPPCRRARRCAILQPARSSARPPS